MEVDRKNEEKIMFADSENLMTDLVEEIVPFTGFTFTQLTDNDILLVAYGDACIQLLDRKRKKKTGIAGKCTEKGDRVGRGSAARFHSPKYILPHRSGHKFLIGDDGNQKIYALNLNLFSNYLEVTVVVSNIVWPQGMAWLSDTALVVWVNDGIEMITNIMEPGGQSTRTMIYENRKANRLHSLFSFLVDGVFLTGVKQYNSFMLLQVNGEQIHNRSVYTSGTYDFPYCFLYTDQKLYVGLYESIIIYDGRYFKFFRIC